jgi:diaminopimelate epimerase
MQTIKFEKWQGIGNDFVMVDGFAEKLDEASLPALSRQMCDRRFGVGSDGLILALPGREVDLQMRMFNPDGSESEMCGNGIRCFAVFAQEHDLTKSNTIPVETGAGLLTLHTQTDHRVRVDMGLARLTRGEIGMTGSPDETFINQPFGEYLGTAVSMGNPHVVIFVDDVAAVDLASIGPILEHHDIFPRRVNVHFVQVVDRTHLIQRTWERGAGATLACGTGACSVGVAAYLNGHTERKTTIKLPGGELEIEYAEDGRVWMTGPATKVFDGVWER